MSVRFALLLAAAGIPALAAEPMGMAEVKALITGRTVDIQNLSSGQAFRAYYAESGDVIIQRADAMEFSGRWSLRPNGMHCVYFDVENCGTIQKNADGTYTRIVGGKPAFKWLKITPGKAF
jgi:hypothetical protein